MMWHKYYYLVDGRPSSVTLGEGEPTVLIQGEDGRFYEDLSVLDIILYGSDFRTSRVYHVVEVTYERFCQVTLGGV